MEISASREAKADIKQVPQDPAIRAAIRKAASEMALRLSPQHPPMREDLQHHARGVLATLDLPEKWLGFAMVAVSNAYWRGAYESVPFNRRLLLLPHCLSDRSSCQGIYDSVGLNCAHCGSCGIDGLKSRAEQLGYSVIVAEGTSSVIMKVLEGEADALLGVACLDSLEKSFTRVVDLGIPQMALPLLRDGCADTKAEVGLILELMHARAERRPQVTRSFLPLLRQTVQIFRQPRIGELLSPCRGPVEGPAGAGALAETERIAIDWMAGGKRLRPFITLVTYAAAKHGLAALTGDADVNALVPESVARVAVAIEVLHKASLVHDDIEDDDEHRYGRQTLHRSLGIGPAVNVGDYLVGLGYALVASERSELGADCVADILADLSQAHLDLCRGQGAELSWTKQRGIAVRPVDVLAMYALKTAPAFEVAFYAGLRCCANVACDRELLRQFSSYLGEGFQIINDLDDWRADDRNKLTRGLDVLAGRPTILRALAAEADEGKQLIEAIGADGPSDPAGLVERVRAVYDRTGAFSKAERLLEKLRVKATESAGAFPTPDLRELMRFLVRVVLPPRQPIE